ncbi:aldehyde dehydrogenase family protein, partial [Burkholderia gladioli]|nr:aldehyde dehydrogenase family protein [Burkholderia gladioli]
TMIGAQASAEQLEKILSYIDIGRQEGAECLTGGERNTLTGELASGYYVKPTVFRGHNKMRIFQEEIFGPVLSVTTFKNEEEALEIANFIMGIPGADDVMLNYQSTSFHDALYVREVLGLRRAPEFEEWLETMEIADAKGALIPAHARAPLLAGAKEWMGIDA